MKSKVIKHPKFAISISLILSIFFGLTAERLFKNLANRYLFIAISFGPTIYVILILVKEKRGIYNILLYFCGYVISIVNFLLFALSQYFHNPLGSFISLTLVVSIFIVGIGTQLLSKESLYFFTHSKIEINSVIFKIKLFLWNFSLVISGLSTLSPLLISLLKRLNSPQLSFTLIIAFYSVLPDFVIKLVKLEDKMMPKLLKFLEDYVSNHQNNSKKS